MSSQMSLFPSKDLPEEKAPSREAELNALDEVFAANPRYRSSLEYVGLLCFIARFAKYSAFNGFLLHTQDPSVSFVATAGTWKKRFRRRLKSTARPLVILAPMSPVRFVYDLKDTEGDPVPAAVLKPVDTQGRMPREVYEKTVRNCSVHGIAVRETLLYHHQPTGAMPLTYHTRRQYESLNIEPQMNYLIALNSAHSLEDRYSALVHELGHIFCGHLGIDSHAWWQDRRGVDQVRVEIEAESVSYLVCLRKGLVGGAEKYLTEYARQDRQMPVFGLNAVLQATHYIEEMGKSRWKAPRKKSLYRSEKKL